MKRYKDYVAGHVRGAENYSKKYGKEQLVLRSLVTHPDFRKRGAGTMLCNWGMEESTKRGGWILTLHASLMGRVLYENLGYKLVGSEMVQVKGEEESVEILCMEKIP